MLGVQIDRVTVIDDRAMICTDCGMLVENGECSGDAETDARCRDALKAESAEGHMWCVNGSDDEGTSNNLEFSWLPCELCGSHLGGYRYAATVLKRAAS